MQMKKQMDADKSENKCPSLAFFVQELSALICVTICVHLRFKILYALAGGTHLRGPFPLLEGRRRPVFELHPERQAVLGQDVLDLGERLLAEIGRLEQLELGTLDQVADVENVLGLEAVGRTHREFEIV